MGRETSGLSFDRSRDLDPSKPRCAALRRVGMEQFWDLEFLLCALAHKHSALISDESRCYGHAFRHLWYRRCQHFYSAAEQVRAGLGDADDNDCVLSCQPVAFNDAFIAALLEASISVVRHRGAGHGHVISLGQSHRRKLSAPT